MPAVEQAFLLVLDPYVIAVILLASVFGLVVGALPGLTATMATALLVPITFFMEPVPAIGAIIAASAMAIFAGDISGTLLRIPGTPASAAYVEDAYRMTGKGQAELALGVCLVTSAIGGLFGALVLAFSAPALAEFALKFSSPEYFWLACFGLSCAVFISTDAPVKGVVSLLIGLFIATIGIDITAGYPRFNFGNVELMGGVSFIPAMIGMFAIGEILRYATATTQPVEVPHQAIVHIFRGLGRVLWRYKTNLMRGNLIGVVVGVLPGAGADIAAWISYAVAKRFSEGAGEVRHRPCRGPGRRRRRQQLGARRRLGAGAGVRHPGRFDHRDRDRGAVHEEHEPRARRSCCTRRSCSTPCSSCSSSPTS